MIDEITTTPAPAPLSQVHAAFAAAYAEMGKVAKDRKNPHFKSNYATFESIDDVVRPALAAHGLALLHRFELFGEGGPVWCRAVAVHADGGEVSTAIPAPGVLDNNPQKAGSAMTYARRYSAFARFGLAPSDDEDGNRAAPATKGGGRANGSALVAKIRAYTASAFQAEPARVEAALAAAFNGAPNLGGGEWHAARDEDLRGLLSYLQTPEGHAAVKAAIA